MAFDFGDIRQKVRKITGNLSSDQLSDDELDDYINKYLQYTFPAEFKLDSNLIPYKFLTVKGQEYYPVPENFTNFVPPALSNGANMRYYTTQNLYYRSLGQYYFRTRLYPGGVSSGITGFTNANPGVITVLNGALFNVAYVINALGIVENTGGTQSLNGVYTITAIAGNQLTVNVDTSTFNTYANSGLVTHTSTTVFSQANQNYPIMPGSVIVTDNVETFTDNGNGTLVSNLGGIGAVNYATGSVSVTFTNPPVTNTSVWVSYQTYQSGQPQIILNFGGNFRLYPVPDGVYQMELIGYQVPEALVNSTQRPKLSEWGYVIAYGAARDIFADNGQIDRYAEITALYKEQVKYVNRRDIQNTLYRTAKRSD